MSECDFMTQDNRKTRAHAMSFEAARNHDGLGDQGAGFLSKKASSPERVSSVM